MAFELTTTSQFTDSSAKFYLVKPERLINPIWVFFLNISWRSWLPSAVMLVTSSIRLMSIPKRVSPGSGIISSRISATPGRNHSLIPCNIWTGVLLLFCPPQLNSLPVHKVFSFHWRHRKLESKFSINKFLEIQVVADIKLSSMYFFFVRIDFSFH